MATTIDHTADRGRHATKPTEIPRAGWRDVAIRTMNESTTDNIGLIAAGVAFYSFLAFVPLLGAVVLTYGLVADPSTVMEHVKGLFRLLPADAAHIISEQLIDVTKQAAAKTGLGLGLALLLALYGAMNGAASIITALNVAYDEVETRGFIHTKLLALGITCSLVLVAVAGVLAISALAFLESLLPGLPKILVTLIEIAFWAGAAVVASGVIAAIYRFAPARRPPKWRWLTAGSVLTTVAWLLMTLGFGLYAANFANYNATYGALGAVVVFLMWLYLSSYVLLLGAELNSEIEHQTAKDTTKGHERPLGKRGAYVADTVGEVPKGLFG